MTEDRRAAETLKEQTQNPHRADKNNDDNKPVGSSESSLWPSSREAEERVGDQLGQSPALRVWRSTLLLEGGGGRTQVPTLKRGGGEREELFYTNGLFKTSPGPTRERGECPLSRRSIMRHFSPQNEQDLFLLLIFTSRTHRDKTSGFKSFPSVRSVAEVLLDLMGDFNVVDRMFCQKMSAM